MLMIQGLNYLEAEVEKLPSIPTIHHEYFLRSWHKTLISCISWKICCWEMIDIYSLIFFCFVIVRSTNFLHDWHVLSIEHMIPLPYMTMTKQIVWLSGNILLKTCSHFFLHSLYCAYESISLFWWRFTPCKVGSRFDLANCLKAIVGLLWRF